MPAHRFSTRSFLLFISLCLATSSYGPGQSGQALGEEDYEQYEESSAEDSAAESDSEEEEEVVAKPLTPKKQPKAKKKKPKRRLEKRKFVTDHPERTDAGIFYVAFGLGGNFYIEPKLNATTKAFADDYFKDFGFQGGVYFDYDYSQLTENVPLGLRGFVGYKYILSSVHVFSVDGLVRRMFNWSENTTFGLGVGGSAAVWFRKESDESPDEEMIFLPSFIIGAGFEFNPFMVDFKWLINRIGAETTIMGFELYFGVRL